ncbi:MAG: U32 family peptidase, partial [Bacteroidales bacterium]|nr:U32 family peptidase [Bacteroidales bacterium]
MLSRKEIELLAPAGSYESLQAAIQGGADAVYFGVEKLNMRSRSSFNFTLDDLDRVIGIAGEHQMHTYLTLNAVIYNNELEQVKEITGRAGEAGITAIIA